MTKPLLIRSKSHHKLTQKKTIFEKVTVKQFVTAIFLMAFIIFLIFYVQSLRFTSSQNDVIKNNPAKQSITNLQNVLNNIDFSVFSKDLQNILKPRVSGTIGNGIVTKHILTRFKDNRIAAKPYVFTDDVPVLEKDAVHLFHVPSEAWVRDPGRTDRVSIPINFTNILAHLGPTQASRVLALACHHDSKYRLAENEYYRRMEDTQFLGATDSAVPCSMILTLAQWLKGLLDQNVLRWTNQERALQMIFFDGEEAFEEWTEYDSLYGSRWMARYMASHRGSGANNANMLQQIELFVLLDLIGERGMQFRNFYRSSNKEFKLLADIEKTLHNMRLLSPSHISPNTFFARVGLLTGSSVQDDHIPFFEKSRVTSGIDCLTIKHDVSILHLISVPFPKSWHKFNDDGHNLHNDSIEDLLKVLAVFLMDYLELQMV